MTLEIVNPMDSMASGVKLYCLTVKQIQSSSANLLPSITLLIFSDEDDTDDGGVLSPYNSEGEAVLDEDAFGNPKNDFKRDVEFDSNFIDGKY